MTRTLSIGNHTIGIPGSCFIIAEVAQSHEGSLGLAHSFIDAAAAAGANAIKFQTHIAQAESTYDEPFRVQFTSQDASRFDYWKRMEFSYEQWVSLKKHSDDRGLVFLSSPFSVEAVNLLEKIGQPAWKVGSGEFFNNQLLNILCLTRKPLLLSTGMANWDEIDRNIQLLNSHASDFALFQCTSSYPSPLNQVGLNVLSDMSRRYGCPVGLSDHSGLPWPSLAAIARGASLVEVHVTFDRNMYGPDVSSSLTFNELKLVCEMRDAFHIMYSNHVDKSVSTSSSTMRSIFTRSIALNDDLAIGTVLDSDHLTLKKPGTGIPYTKIDDVIGRVLTKNVSRDRLLTWDDLGDAPDA